MTKTPARAKALRGTPACSRPPKTWPSWPPSCCAPPMARATGCPKRSSRSSRARMSWPPAATAGWAGASSGRPNAPFGHNGFTGTYIRVELDRKMYLVLLTNAVHPTRDNNKLGGVRRAFSRSSGIRSSCGQEASTTSWLKAARPPVLACPRAAALASRPSNFES